jgi:YebC/PmpR family DNA-binding regulatory protein
VPGENIDRAVKKGTGELESEVYEEFTYEGYGPAGVAILVDLMTDNRNRTAQDVRKIFHLHGGNLGENGCVAWMFDRRGYFALEKGALSEEQLMELALELEAEDAVVQTDVYEIFTSMETYLTIGEELERRGVPVVARELAMIPQTYLAVEPGRVKQVLRLIEALEDNDDVQNVWSNLQLDETEPGAPAS